MELKHNVRLILRQESLQVHMKEPFRWVAACYRDWLWKPPNWSTPPVPGPIREHSCTRWERSKRCLVNVRIANIDALIQTDCFPPNADTRISLLPGTNGVYGFGGPI